MSVFHTVVSEEGVCGERVGLCGDDAFCNNTGTDSLCQCKAGFQRSQTTRQCEGTVRWWCRLWPPPSSGFLLHWLAAESLKRYVAFRNREQTARRPHFTVHVWWLSLQKSSDSSCSPDNGNAQRSYSAFAFFLINVSGEFQIWTIRDRVCTTPKRLSLCIEGQSSDRIMAKALLIICGLMGIIAFVLCLFPQRSMNAFSLAHALTTVQILKDPSNARVTVTLKKSMVNV